MIYIITCIVFLIKFYYKIIYFINVARSFNIIIQNFTNNINLLNQLQIINNLNRNNRNNLDRNNLDRNNINSFNFYNIYDNCFIT